MKKTDKRPSDEDIGRESESQRERWAPKKQQQRYPKKTNANVFNTCTKRRRERQEKIYLYT